MKVDFMVIGAQKSGTTSMARQLATHPAVCFCSDKEPAFFNTCADWRERLAEYHALYSPQPGQLLAEASTMYTFSCTEAPWKDRPFVRLRSSVFTEGASSTIESQDRPLGSSAKAAAEMSVAWSTEITSMMAVPSTLMVSDKPAFMVKSALSVAPGLSSRFWMTLGAKPEIVARYQAGASVDDLLI